MNDGKTEERLWKAKVTARLRSLLADMDWSVNDFASQIHEQAGVQEKAVTQWFNRESIPAHKLTVIARYLGVDIRYLMLDSQVDSPSALPKGVYARERELHHLRAKLAEKQSIRMDRTA